MSYTRAQWSAAFLAALGNANPASAILGWVISWTRFETSAGKGAAYNLLNTTQTAPGSTKFNSVGVQNFVSFAQGTQTNAKVLANGLYPTLLQALKNNQASALGIGGAPTAAINAQLATWGTNATASQIAASLGAGANDSFPGSTSGTTSAISVVSAQSNAYPKDQCTWWANERFHQVTGYYVPWSGNANAWAAQAKKYAGWNVTPNAASPAIIVLQAGVQLADPVLGHVGFVESINNDGSVVASNSHWAGHIYPDTTRVTFKPGPGVSFITAGAQNVGPGPGPAIIPDSSNGNSTSNGLPGDVAALFGAIGALFGGQSVPPPETLLQQVHTTLVEHPGFYGIALAIDEVEQFPGYVNLASGPFDVIGIVRSVGASVGDNFIPFWIRGALVSLGVLIIILLIAKVVLQVGEKTLQSVAPLLPLLG